MGETVVEHRIEKTFFHPFSEPSVEIGSVRTGRHLLEKIFAQCPSWVGSSQLGLCHVVFEDFASQVHLDHTEGQHIDITDAR